MGGTTYGCRVARKLDRSNAIDSFVIQTPSKLLYHATIIVFFQVENGKPEITGLISADHEAVRRVQFDKIFRKPL